MDYKIFNVEMIINDLQKMLKKASLAHFQCTVPAFAWRERKTMEHVRQDSCFLVLKTL
jgi:hypothetical protein